MALLALFIAVPLIEIALFIQVGGLIGLWPTLLIVLVTAIVGTMMVRQQGALAMSQLRQSFGQLNDPSEPLAHGAMILFSGALLLTPGFFTDAVGFALLFPPVRALVFREAKKRIKVQSFQMGAHGAHGANGPQGASGFEARPKMDGDVIDGEWSDAEVNAQDTPGSSGWTRH